MRPSFMTPMQRMQGWRLWVVFTIATVIVAEVIVSVMSIVLKGEIYGDYLVTGLAAAGIVAPVSLALPSHILEGLAWRSTLAQPTAHPCSSVAQIRFP